VIGTLNMKAERGAPMPKCGSGRSVIPREGGLWPGARPGADFELAVPARQMDSDDLGVPVVAYPIPMRQPTCASRIG
jgi:hypothetical protein